MAADRHVALCVDLAGRKPYGAGNATAKENYNRKNNQTKSDSPRKTTRRKKQIAILPRKKIASASLTAEEVIYNQLNQRGAVEIELHEWTHRSNIKWFFARTGASTYCDRSRERRASPCPIAKS
ncbi:MAG TPA: hypothetical protein VNZ53_32500 [Steroidobacteraceae bacterium]|nr:hypothetical protein [Steroidobacteraceae bacterium]